MLRRPKSALYALVKRLRVATPRPEVRFEGLPGEFTLHDFGEVLVRSRNDTVKRVHFFASPLKYLRWLEATVMPNQQVETLTRTLVDHCAAIGGIPLAAVLDRPKTVALSWKKNGEFTEWNPVFAGVVLNLGSASRCAGPMPLSERERLEIMTASSPWHHATPAQRFLGASTIPGDGKAGVVGRCGRYNCGRPVRSRRRCGSGSFAVRAERSCPRRHLRFASGRHAGDSPHCSDTNQRDLVYGDRKPIEPTLASSARSRDHVPSRNVDYGRVAFLRGEP